MKDRIRQAARELGFDGCAFTTAAPPASAPHLHRWLAEGRHGTMAWMARNAARRTNLQAVLPGAQSVVCLAVSYASETPSPSPAACGPAGIVARYAQHADYHDILGARLKTLSGRINAWGGEGTRSLWYVDTGPVLERDLAQRAGLGFVGKHTNLISRSRGNWLLLSEILTTLPLEPDPPEPNRCGHCRRCLDACPTQAITAPFQLDARRCISYLTIELKGSIPVELRPLIGARIFGCDDCLEICPWNRFARAGRLMSESLVPDLAGPDLLGLLSLDEAAFAARFAGTPLLRGKRRGLLRNACVALGNVGDATALPALGRAAADPDPLIAEHATWAIREMERRGKDEIRNPNSRSPQEGRNPRAEPRLDPGED